MISHSFFDVRSSFELLFRVNKSLATVDHLLDELDFGESDPLVVGNVPLAARAGRRVLAAAASGLDAETLGEVLELVWREGVGELGNQNHGGASQAGAQVGGARVDVAEVVIKLLAGALALEDLADLLHAARPAVEDAHDVAAVLHRDDPHVVFLVDPHEELAAVRAEDSSVVRPVASCTGCRQQRRPRRLLEQVPASSQLFRHRFVH